MIRSDDNLALSILRQIEEEARRRSRVCKMPRWHFKLYHEPKRDHVAQIEARYGLSVRVEGDPMLVSPDFSIEKFKTATRYVPEAAEPYRPIQSSWMKLTRIPPKKMTSKHFESEQDDERKPKRRRRRRRRKGQGGDQAEGSEDQTSDEAVADEDAAADADAAKVLKRIASRGRSQRRKTKRARRSRKKKAEFEEEQPNEGHKPR